LLGAYSEGGWGDDGRARTVCSAERGYRLQERLRHEVNEGKIDPRDAERLADRIAGLSAKARHECSESDGRAVGDIAGRYDGIQQWIDRSTQGSGSAAVRQRSSTRRHGPLFTPAARCLAA
jgi:hypothetical protein